VTPSGKRRGAVLSEEVVVFLEDIRSVVVVVSLFGKLLYVLFEEKHFNFF